MENVGYKKTYRLRCAVPNAKSIEVTFPYEVVQRQATINNMTVDEFIKLFEVVAEFNGFDGVRYTFHPRVNEFPSIRSVIDLWEEVSYQSLGKPACSDFAEAEWVKINVPIEITRGLMKLGCGKGVTENHWKQFMEYATAWVERDR